jgi:hypothetical protein
VASVADGTADGDSHNCSAGAGYSCSGGINHERHNDCNPEFAVGTVNQMWRLLLDADGSAIAAAAQEHNTAVRINSERRALQIVGCSGAILAHLPLTEQQFMAAKAATGL